MYEHMYEASERELKILGFRNLPLAWSYFCLFLSFVAGAISIALLGWLL